MTWDTLVTARWVLTQDADRSVIEDGFVAVADGLVAATGAQGSLEGRQAARRLDLGQAIVLPGLVNAHTHAPMSLLRGVADDLPLMSWLQDHIFPIEARLTRDIVDIGAELACAEMLSFGVTAFLDMYMLVDGVARAADACGMRCLTGEGLFAFPTPGYADHDDWERNLRALHERYADNLRVGLSVNNHSVYLTTPDLLRRSFALAEELDAPWAIHLAESAAETAQCLEQFGKRPVACLDDLGLLTPRTVAAHCVDLTGDETSLLAERGVNVVHCPESNLKLASGISPVPELLAAGVNVALGTDGAASNNSLDLLAEAGTAALVHKRHDPTQLPAQKALDLATFHGARALGMPGLGRLVPGAPADLVAVDAAAPHMLPCYNPVSQLVYAATGADVRLTMVAGEVLYRNGVFTRLDLEALRAGVAKARTWVLSALQKS